MESVRMSERIQNFVADELWLAIGALTLPAMMLFDTIGPAVLAEVSLIVGWFLLAPLFLFWGEDIAAVVFSSDEAEGSTNAQEDAIEKLKRRYAAGEIDEREFEQRLDRLVATEEGGPAEVGDLTAGDRTSDPLETNSLESAKRERELE
ncbi:putative membrane protein [Halorhabdus sp. SVX81]|uniref:SHOCT domain-containing protein n=1 Tax=Halorhabdus sp. SVX81 TaxID=2978283 RepID=UPI0023DA4DE5|nr:SHOCT domain-containing protein [Halorhabdus sp. SVX81]WEL18463.1 putative membrane protein [Halorhabdus sp. SVX81]